LFAPAKAASSAVRSVVCAVGLEAMSLTNQQSVFAVESWPW